MWDFSGAIVFSILLPDVREGARTVASLAVALVLGALSATSLAAPRVHEVVITEPVSVAQYDDAIAVYLHGFDVMRTRHPDLELTYRLIRHDGTAGDARTLDLTEPWEKPGIILRKDGTAYHGIAISATSGTNVFFRRLYDLDGTLDPQTQIATLAQNAFIEPGQFLAEAPQIPLPDLTNLASVVVGAAARTNSFDATTLNVRSDLNYPLVSGQQLAALTVQTDHPTDRSKRSIYVPLKSQLFDPVTGEFESVLHYVCEIPLDSAWLNGTEDEVFNIDAGDIRVHWTDQTYQGRNLLGHTGGGLGQGTGTMDVDADGNIYYSNSMLADVVRFNVHRQTFEATPVNLEHLSDLLLPTDDEILGNGGTGKNGRWNGFKMVASMNHAAFPRMLYGRTVSDYLSNGTYGWAGLFTLPTNWDDPVGFTNEFRLLVGSWPSASYSFYETLPVPGGDNRRIQYYASFGDCVFVKDYPRTEGGPWRVDLTSNGTVAVFGSESNYPGVFNDYSTKPRDVKPYNANMLRWQDYGLLEMSRNDLYRALTGTNTTSYSGELEVSYDAIGHMLLNTNSFRLILDNMGGPSLAPRYMAAPVPGQDGKLLGMAEYGSYFVAEYDVRTAIPGEVEKEYLILDSIDPALELPLAGRLRAYAYQWCEIDGDDWLYMGGYTGLARFQYCSNGVPLQRTVTERFDTDLNTTYLDTSGSGSIKRHRYLEHGLDDRMFLTGHHTAGRGGTGFSGGLLAFHKTQRDTLWRLSYMSRCYNTVKLRSRVIREPDDAPLQEFCLVGGMNNAYTNTVPPADIPVNKDPKVFLYDVPAGGDMRDRMGFAFVPLAGESVFLRDLAYSSGRRYLVVMHEDRVFTFDLQRNRYIDGKRLTFGSGINVESFFRPDRTFLRAPDDRLFLYVSPAETATYAIFLEVLVSPAGELSFQPFLEMRANSSSDLDETSYVQQTFLPDLENDDGSYDLFLGQERANTDCRLIEDFVPPRRHELARTLNVLSRGVGGAPIDGTKPGVTPYSGVCADGQRVDLTASTPDGYLFKEWQDEDGNPLGVGDALQVDMDVDRIVTAVYERIPEHSTVIIVR